MKNALKRQIAAILSVIAITSAGSCIPASAAQTVSAAKTIQGIGTDKIIPLIGKELIFNTNYGYLLNKKAYLCYDSNLKQIVNLLHPGIVYHFSAFYQKGNLILGKYGKGYVILAENGKLNCSLVFRASLIRVPIKSAPTPNGRTIAYVNKGNDIYFNEIPRISGTYAYVSQLNGWADLSIMEHIDNPSQHPLIPNIILK